MVAEANAAVGAPAVGQQPPAPPAPPQPDMQIDGDDEEPMRIVKNYQRPSTRQVADLLHPQKEAFPGWLADMQCWKPKAVRYGAVQSGRA